MQNPMTFVANQISHLLTIRKRRERIESLLTSVTMNFGGGEISEAPAFAVPRSHRRCWTARPDLGERWPSRLVATAAEDCLNSHSRCAIKGKLGFSENG
jgi:hypothetical protein